MGGSTRFGSAIPREHLLVAGTVLRSRHTTRSARWSLLHFQLQSRHTVIPCSLELRYECRRRGGSKVSAGGGGRCFLMKVNRCRIVLMRGKA